LYGYLGAFHRLQVPCIATTSGPHRGVKFARCEQQHSSLYY
jgi:hypothetical protein